MVYMPSSGYRELTVKGKKVTSLQKKVFGHSKKSLSPAQLKARGGRVQSVAGYFSKGKNNIPVHRGESAATTGSLSLSPSTKRKFESLQPRQCLEFDNLTLPEHQPSRGIVIELERQAKKQSVTALNIV